MLLRWLDPLFWQNADANATVSRDMSPPSLKFAAKSCAFIAPEFHFADAGADALSAVERQRFVVDFESAATSLRAWSLQQAYRLTVPRKLCVFVSAQFHISRALVPAWEGRSGTIEFPARRVIAGQAAIVHELAHVLFPNGNRLLAEGLAIYLQELLGRNPAFPNFSQPLHDAASRRLEAVLPAFAADAFDLGAFRLASLDAIPTPNPLTLEIAGHVCGEDKDGQAILYCLAGSFVQFLIDAYGFALFRRLYLRTPLRVGELCAGSAERWAEIYDKPLSDLEGEWKAFLVNARNPERAFAKPT
jgi:hypothetical protein